MAWKVIVHLVYPSIKAVFKQSYIIHALHGAGGFLLDICDLVHRFLN